MPAYKFTAVYTIYGKTRVLTSFLHQVLYKSRCDNRLNEITERAIADKREVYWRFEIMSSFFLSFDFGFFAVLEICHYLIPGRDAC